MQILVRNISFTQNKKEKHKLKVAIVHDWLVSYRGGEKVLEAICELYPNAPIYTLFYDPKKLPPSLTRKDIRYSKKLNFFRRVRKLLLPFLPFFVESISLSDYDLIISTSSCVAKGIIPGPNTKHLSYVHSPMRYIWDQQKDYLSTKQYLPGMVWVIRYLCYRLRMWDTMSSCRVDYFVANSHFVSKRIEKYYRRRSEVIHPPINLSFFSDLTPPKRRNYFLIAGAFVPYKKFDLAIKACETLGRRLIVAGKGEEEERLKKISGPHTEFHIEPNDAEWKKLLSGADALIFPGVEDFGMIAVEAMACGTPVIAFKKGGALDFIKPGISGCFFTEQTPESLQETLLKFSLNDYDHNDIIHYAKNFSKERFTQKFQRAVDQLLREGRIIES